MEWQGRRRRELRGRKSHKNTLYKIYVREWLRTHTNTHTRNRRDKSMQGHKKDKVPGTQPPRWGSRLGLGVQARRVIIIFLLDIYCPKTENILIKLPAGERGCPVSVCVCVCCVSELAHRKCLRTCGPALIYVHYEGLGTSWGYRAEENEEE